VDNLDKRILWDLLRDGRKSFTAIAKENDVSEDTIWKRYKEMQKKGIITGATIQYNYRLFGYSAVAAVRLNVESQNINSVLDSLQSWPFIGMGAKVLDSLNLWPKTGEGAKGVSRLFGSQYTISVFVIFKSLGALEKVKEIISKQHPINGFDTNLWVDTRAIPEKIINYSPQLSQEDKNANETADPQQYELLKLDDWDMKIVEKLSEDGRIPFGKIAKEIGISTDTVTRRYERLKKNNYIRSVLQIDPQKLGYQGYLLILIELSMKGYINEMVDELSKVSGVHDIIRLSGAFDLEIVVHVKDCYDIASIHKEIEKIPYIKRIETCFGQAYNIWPPRRTPITTF
jgi:DNA-binding Lrp family transcriptional regulator